MRSSRVQTEPTLNKSTKYRKWLHYWQPRKWRHLQHLYRFRNYVGLFCLDVNKGYARRAKRHGVAVRQQRGFLCATAPPDRCVSAACTLAQLPQLQPHRCSEPPPTISGGSVRYRAAAGHKTARSVAIPLCIVPPTRTEWWMERRQSGFLWTAVGKYSGTGACFAAHLC